MKTERYLRALARHHELPLGLASYLTVALQEFKYKKGTLVNAQELNDLYIPCIDSGLAMLCSKTIAGQEVGVHEFYAKGDFLPALPPADPALVQQAKLLFLEDTTLLALEEKHYTFLPKVLITISLIYRKISTGSLSRQINKEAVLQIKAGEKRLEAFWHCRPELRGRIEEKYLDRYLRLNDGD
ncbi:hypothetical protein [Pedobacter sp. GR22-10]|uniref:hypothetical protein n=1 Tax=Pedobacter sp. GR22-10 TaxID=2994472 RepID=UPI0022457AEA|nr:hypothetical protein [Pedobacter sp. GR22-10]MCX2429605.1 hypothetical protein [Pedobacter sp. GR22-10]